MNEQIPSTVAEVEESPAEIGTGEMLPPSPVPRADKSLSDYQGQLEAKRKRR